MTTVTEHLLRRGVHFHLRPHPRATSAAGEALALGIGADAVVKAVLLDLEDGHALAIVPAAHRLDLDLLRDALGQPQLHIASEHEVASDYPEFELGALPPLPDLYHVPVVVDPSVFAHQYVTLAAGTQETSVEVDVDDVIRASTVTIATVSHPYTGEEGLRSPS